uniref:Uncharacterized protein n=1 Tax=Peronospora matthiolae TaxID=2874970 RepID=A0AAV1V945_9STRA
MDCLLPAAGKRDVVDAPNEHLQVALAYKRIDCLPAAASDHECRL